MNDINLLEIKELTRKANESVLFGEYRFPYIVAYEIYNKAIIEKANKGENSISFDFVDHSID